jgi:ribosome-associated protein
MRAAAAVRDAVGMRDVAIRDEMIRLGQFLKLADKVQAGSDVKAALAAGEVLVNGEIETRRGRQLARGDVILVGGDELRVG